MSHEKSAERTPPKRRRRLFTLKNKRHMPAWLGWLLARLVGLYGWTFRVRYDDPDGWLESGSPGQVVMPSAGNQFVFGDSGAKGVVEAGHGSRSRVP